MELASRPRDTTEEIWSHVLACQRARSGQERIESLLDQSAAMQEVHAGNGGKERSVTSLEELFAFVVSALDSAEVPFMVVGSFASTYHALPRSTQDLDLVCELGWQNFDRFCEVFSGEDFYFSKEAAQSAVADQGMFNLIHPTSGWKIDVIVKKNRDFSRREFERRIKVELFGKLVSVASAEDTILSKLEWAKESMSERQLRDVAEIFDVLGDRLDRDYLDMGVRELGLERVLERVEGPW